MLNHRATMDHQRFWLYTMGKFVHDQTIWKHNFHRKYDDIAVKQVYYIHRDILGNVLQLFEFDLYLVTSQYSGKI